VVALPDDQLTAEDAEEVVRLLALLDRHLCDRSVRDHWHAVQCVLF
jgi:hypothetical protein